VACCLHVSLYTVAALLQLQPRPGRLLMIDRRRDGPHACPVGPAGDPTTETAIDIRCMMTPPKREAKLRWTADSCRGS